MKRKTLLRNLAMKVSGAHILMHASCNCKNLIETDDCLLIVPLTDIVDKKVPECPYCRAKYEMDEQDDVIDASEIFITN